MHLKVFNKQYTPNLKPIFNYQLSPPSPLEADTGGQAFSTNPAGVGSRSTCSASGGFDGQSAPLTQPSRSAPR